MKTEEEWIEYLDPNTSSKSCCYSPVRVEDIKQIQLDARKEVEAERDEANEAHAVALVGWSKCKAELGKSRGESLSRKEQIDELIAKLGNCQCCSCDSGKCEKIIQLTGERDQIRKVVDESADVMDMAVEMCDHYADTKHTATLVEMKKSLADYNALPHVKEKKGTK